MIDRKWAAITAAIALVAAGAVAVAFASDWGSGSKRSKYDRKSGRTAVTRLMQFDADKDGRITRAEIDAGIEAQFRSADTNGDGKLDGAEFQKYNDARKSERKARYEAWRAKNPDAPERAPADNGRDGLDQLKYADWNLDGYVTPEEFGIKTRTQAMRADRNGDGAIDADEMTQGRRVMGG
jgi:hypothetical protein